MRFLAIRAFYGLSLTIATTFAGAEPGAPALTGVPAAAPAAAPAANYLGAMGIGVSDLQRSTSFYTEVLGLEVMRTYELGYIEEIVLGWPDSTGAVVVLMHWPDQPRRYDGNDVKLVFYVDDPAAVIARIRERGGRIDREATPHEAVDGAIVGLGRDPDNYVVEVLER
jgi:catechol 2,3-dioxygenase-like lactoylglutathione lyase family enzyme